MRGRGPDRGDPARARDGPRASPSCPGSSPGWRGPGCRGRTRRSSSSGSPAAATRTSRRSSERCRHDPDDDHGGGRIDDAAVPRHERHGRRPTHRGGLRPGDAGRGARRSSRTSSPATRTPRRACGSPSPPPTPARTCSRSACRTRTRSPTAPRSSGRRAWRSRAGATLDGSLALIERIAAARPGVPLVPMAYANQVIGGGDGAGRGPTARRGRRQRASSSPT